MLKANSDSGQEAVAQVNATPERQLRKFQVRVNHRVNGQLETYITHIYAKSQVQAKRMAKHIALDLDGHLIDVIEEVARCQ